MISPEGLTLWEALLKGWPLLAMTVFICVWFRFLGWTVYRERPYVYTPPKRQSPSEPGR